MFSTTRLVHLLNIGLSTRSILLFRNCQQSRTLFISNCVSYTSNRFFSEKKNKQPYINTQLSLRSFEVEERKEKETYLECLRQYQNQPGRKSDRVEFIYAALKYMKEFGVANDLESYKKLFDTFPKGKMIPTNRFQAELMHYPKEQKCATYVLEQMENNKVIPDTELNRLLLNIFGKDSIPIHKLWRMLYWMPKFKNISPWPLPRPLPNDSLELAKLAIWRITTVDVQTQITIFKTDTLMDSIDKTWIVSAMAPKQKKLLENHKPHTKVIYVEGPFTTWVGDKAVDYFTLSTKIPKEEKRKIPFVDTDDVSNLDVSYWTVKKTSIIPYPSVHEQIHETIFSVCATGTSSKDSVLSWIRFLQKENPILSKLHVVFTLKQKPEKETKLLEGNPESETSEDQKERIDEK